MRVLIIEDETPAAERLITLLKSIDDAISVLQVLDSIESSVNYLQAGHQPNLIFMDIQLADGPCFEIFQQVEVKAPVVFTTAYDQYAIQAFKVNSIDYLLKPIDTQELDQAIEKYWTLQTPAPTSPGLPWAELLQSLQQPTYQKRFLVKVGEQFRYVPVAEIAYFMAESGLVLLVNQSARTYPVDYKLEQLQDLLDPSRFFRINRGFLVQISAIEQIHTYFNSRLKLSLAPPQEAEVVVSRDRVAAFKRWLNA